MGVRSSSSDDRDLARQRQAELRALLAEPRGARFMLADLQVHTPRDGRFEPGPEPQDPAERRRLAEAYLAKAVERGVSVVAITEHDDVSWIDDLRAAADSVGLRLLPGFEVETREGVHMLCLFGADTPVPVLRRALDDVGVGPAGPPPEHAPPPVRRAHDDPHGRRMPFAELLYTIQDRYGGICIAAHVESDKGLLHALGGTARVQAWRNPDLLAVQVAAPPAASEHRNPTIIGGHAQAYERERPPAYVLTSDGRSFERIGVPSTWIKLDEVSPVGLRQAFVDADSRVSYEDPARLRRGPRLLAVGWHGGMLDGVRIGLSDQLTCLIGRNGAGKSAVLESVRYALGLGHATPRGERTAEALLAAVLRDARGAMVAVETDGDGERRRYLVLRRADGAEPVVCDAEGNEQTDVDPADLIEPRMIGQGELDAIGASAQAQLELLEALARDSGHGDGRGGRRGIVSRLNEALTGRLRIDLGAQPAGVAIEANVGRPREAYEFRALDDLTPAQRRAALLLLVLEAHTRAPGPLVLDQPEEGLDGSTVDELLARRLRELKRSGQVVLATHDHSLPLRCDAEQIVALESVRPRKKRPRFIRLRAQGAIDRADVRAAAEEILEGGGDSFSLRSAKYGR